MIRRSICRAVTAIAMAPVLLGVPHMVPVAHAHIVPEVTTTRTCDEALRADEIGNTYSLGSTCGSAQIFSSAKSRTIWAEARVENASNVFLKITYFGRPAIVRQTFGRTVKGRDNWTLATQSLPAAPGIYRAELIAGADFTGPFGVKYYTRIAPVLTVRIT